MTPTEPPAPYRVVYSAAVARRLEELAGEAAARGDGDAFAAAYQEFDRLLHLFPQFGDPQIDLKAHSGTVYQGIIRPLAMRYGVLEDLRIVFCGAPPRLLPMDKPEGEAAE